MAFAPRRSSLFLAVLLTGSTLAGGCGMTIAVVNPQPHVQLAPSKRTLVFKTDKRIEEDFDLPSRNGVIGAQFRGYRTSLKRGFKAAFRSVYAAPEEGAKPDLTLMLLRARPSFVPSQGGGGEGGGGEPGAAAQIDYQARLLDAAGGEIGQSNGLVLSTRSFSRPGDAQASVQQAMEAMYEKIAADLGNGLADAAPVVAPPEPPPPAAAPPPPPTAPARSKGSKKK